MDNLKREIVVVVCVEFKMSIIGNKRRCDEMLEDLTQDSKRRMRDELFKMQIFHVLNDMKMEMKELRMQVEGKAQKEENKQEEATPQLEKSATNPDNDGLVQKFISSLEKMASFSKKQGEVKRVTVVAACSHVFVSEEGGDENTKFPYVDVAKWINRNENVQEALRSALLTLNPKLVDPYRAVKGYSWFHRFTCKDVHGKTKALGEACGLGQKLHKPLLVCHDSEGHYNSSSTYSIIAHGEEEE